MDIQKDRQADGHTDRHDRQIKFPRRRLKTIPTTSMGMQQASDLGVMMPFIPVLNWNSSIQ